MPRIILISSPSRREVFAPLSSEAELSWVDDLGDGELEALLPSVECIYSFSWPGRLDPSRLRRMQNLRLVQSELAGVNNVPFESLESRVLVCSNAGAYSQTVAEYAWALLLCAVKKVAVFNSAVRDPRFARPPPLELGREMRVLHGATLGVIGFGGIGKAVAAFGKSFQMNVRAFVRRAPDETVDYVTGNDGLLRLLEGSDFCVLCIPLTRKTRGMIGAAELSVMKKEAVLVNVARGELVDEESLYNHLLANPGFTYATDVWWSEGGKESFSPKLGFLSLKNFLATPHASGPSALVTDDPAKLAVENVLRYLRGEQLYNLVDKAEYL